MSEPALTDDEFGDIMYETIIQMNTLRRTLAATYIEKQSAARAIAIATVIASCMPVTESDLDQAQTTAMVNSTLSLLHQPWQLIRTK